VFWPSLYFTSLLHTQRGCPNSRIQKDMERSGHGLIWATFSEFVSNDWGKPWITLIIMEDISTKIQARYLPYTSKKCHDSGHYTLYSSSVFLFHVHSIFILLQSIKCCYMTKEPPLCSERIGFSNVQNREEEPKRCVN